MANPRSIPVHVLQSEGERLRRLYQEFATDQDFLSADDGKRFVYFSDAHDILSYINPDTTESLQGFMIEAEALAAPDSESKLRLRSDQIMSGLLFPSEGILGLFPSHAKSLDREFFVKGPSVFKSQLDLLVQARSDLHNVREKAKRFLTAAEHRPHLQIDAVRLIKESAPALVALLTDERNTPEARFRAVITDSAIVNWHELEWADFDPKAETALLGFAPDDAAIDGVRAELDRMNFRRNSPKSNEIDASALVYLHELDSRVKGLTAGRVSVRLVSRAWSLLRSAIELSDRHPDRPMLVRHPRLLALAASDGLALGNGGRLMLDTTLSIYIEHLKSNSSTESTDAVRRGVDAFVQAWEEYEASRLTVEAMPRIDADPDRIDKEFQQLYSLFRSPKPEIILNELVLGSFIVFAERAAHFLMDKNDLLAQARVERINGRCEVTPLSAGPIGPIEIMLKAELRSPTSLEDIAGAVGKHSKSSRLLIWSTALATAHRWDQAGFFADASRQVALLETTPGASAGSEQVAFEATLLRAEIHRLGLPEVVKRKKDIIQQFETSLDDLERLRKRVIEPTLRARVIRERAAQVIEASLRDCYPADRDASRELLELSENLEQATRLELSPATKVRLLGVLLLLHLVAERKMGFWTNRRVEQQRFAHDCHQQLMLLLSILTSATEPPYRAHAIVLISCRFQRLWSGAATRADATVNPIDMLPTRYVIDLTRLGKVLADSTDAIGRFLKVEIEDALRENKLAYTRHMQLSPIKTTGYRAMLLDAEGDLGALIAQSYDELDSLLEAYQVHGPDSAMLERFDRAIEQQSRLVGQVKARLDWKAFQFRADLLLARLMRAMLLDEKSRMSELRDLDLGYQGLSKDFPDNSLPYVRRAYIVEEPALELELLRRARDLVPSDPFLKLVGQNKFHWIWSFTNRAYLARTLPASARRRVDPATEAKIQDEDIRALSEALQTLVALDDQDDYCSDDHNWAVERARRRNNLVMYAARLLERVSAENLDHIVSVDRVTAIAGELLRVEDDKTGNINKLHTLGCFYRVLSDPEKPRALGLRILEQLRVGVPNQMPRDEADEIWREVLTWIEPEMPPSEAQG